MKVKYLQDTDTVYIEFRSGRIVDTKDLDENTQLDVDAEGRICALTIERARDEKPLNYAGVYFGSRGAACARSRKSKSRFRSFPERSSPNFGNGFCNRTGKRGMRSLKPT